MSFVSVGVGLGTAVAGAAVSSALAPSGGGGNAANAADPFAGQRGQYQTMLANLINNPSSVTNDPGYNFGLNQGIQSVQGSAASKGMLNSGNTLAGIDQFSQQYAGSYLSNQELLLAQLAGANIGSPGTAGQILNSQQQQQQQAASAVGNQISGIVGQGLGNYFGGGSGGGNPFAGAGGNTYGFSTGISDPSYGVSGGMFGG